MGNSVTSIAKGVFDLCTGITSIIIPNSVTSIGESAFYGCSGLTSVTIPNFVTSIDKDAFSGCTGLTSVCIGNSVTTIGDGAFSGCSGLTSVTIPNSVTSIVARAFNNCTSLASVYIGNSVTNIGQYAFNACSNLKSVTIGQNVKSIGSYAFRNCTGLKEFYVTGEKSPNCDSYVFQSSNQKNATLYVSADQLSYYQSTSPWRNFGTIKADATQIESTLTSAEDVNLDIKDGIIYITNLPTNTPINIYTANGELYGTRRATPPTTTLQLPHQALYIIKTLGKTFKVKL